MKISPTYKDRTDLSVAEKWRYTVEEFIAETPMARAMYRNLFFPRFAEPIWFIISLPALLSTWLFVPIKYIVEFMHDDEDSDLGDKVLFSAWVLAMLALPFLHSLGWILTVSALVMMFTLWFVGIMRDYEEELSVGWLIQFKKDR